MLETLQNYVEDHPPQRSPDEVLKALHRISQKEKTDGYIQNPFIEVMRSMAKLWIKKANSKCRCIIVTGESNAGKTRLARYCSNIFYSVEMVQSQSKFNQSLAEVKIKPQIVIFDEAHMNSLFNKHRRYDTKRFFEGNGMCWEEKGKSPGSMFKDCVCLITA